MDKTREPFWLLVFIGSMAVDVGVSLALSRTLASGAVEHARATGWHDDLSALHTRDPNAPVDLARASPRELRRLPGVGEIRALAIARERWARRASGTRLELEDLPGIGPVTATRIRRAARASDPTDAHGARVERAPVSGKGRDGELP